MFEPHPVEVAVEIDAIRAWTTLERLRTRIDPRESPVAVIIHHGHDAATRFREELGVIEIETPEQQSFACGWAPRARVLRALERVEPLEAVRLRRIQASDVRVWAMVHAASSCRVGDHGRRGPVARAAESAILGAVYTRGCLDTRCTDGSDDHEWDEREIVDEAGEPRDDTTCVRCGLPDDLYATWSAWGF